MTLRRIVRYQMSNKHKSNVQKIKATISLGALSLCVIVSTDDIECISKMAHGLKLNRWKVGET